MIQLIVNGFIVLFLITVVELPLTIFKLKETKKRTVFSYLTMAFLAFILSHFISDDHKGFTIIVVFAFLGAAFISLFRKEQ